MILLLGMIAVLIICSVSARCKEVSYTSDTIKDNDYVWYDASESPCRLYGVYPPSEQYPYFYRMPESIAETVSPMVKLLSTHTAGGRVRFTTDSPVLAIHAEEWQGGVHQNIDPISITGFGIYTGTEESKAVFRCTTLLPCGFEGYDTVVPLNGKKETVTVCMPLYGGVKKLYIGIKKNCLITPAPNYTYEKPVVFYGSSITQGGCASRPGNSYQGIISRQLDMNYINMGFSGSAQGEQSAADYIAGLDMSVFVLDYDHNAPTSEHLRKTHYRFYTTIRKSHPEIPIIFVSRPVLIPNADEQERINIIFESYRKALEKGDKNVYLILGTSFFEGYAADSWSVDGTHPNDFGFVMMAKKIQEVLEPLLK